MASPAAGAGSSMSLEPSWHVDPLVRVPRLRWWAGDRWTAWVVESPADGPSIAWAWGLAQLPAPIRWGTPVLRVATAPPLIVEPQAHSAVTPTPPSVDTPLRTVEDRPPVPVVDASSPVAIPAELPHPKRRLRRRHLVPIAAALSLALGGVAGAALLSSSSGPSRPSLSNVVSYRDPTAGLSLAYPSPWRVQHRDPGRGVTFLAGGAAVPARARTTVAVTVGSQRGPLPALSDFERSTLSTYAAQDLSLRVSGGGEATLAGGPALDVVLTDPPTAIEVVEGRTADLRPLVVTLTTHDPRGALTRSTVQDVLTSIGS